MYSVGKRITDAHEDSVWCVSFGRSGSDQAHRFVTGSLDERAVVWKTTASGEIEKERDFGNHSFGVVSVDIAPSKPIAASTALDGALRLWDLDSGAVLRTLQDNNSIVENWAVRFTADGKYVCSSSKAGHVSLYDVESGERVQQMEMGNVFGMSLATSSNHRTLACGATNGSVSVFDIETGRRLHSIQAHEMPVRSLAFSTDSKHLITASDDTHAHMYDVGSGELVATFSGHRSWVLSVSVSDDQRHFATGSADGTVRLWELRASETVQTLNDHTDQVWGVAFGAHGSQLVSVSEDKSIVMYRRA